MILYTLLESDIGWQTSLLELCMSLLRDSAYMSEILKVSISYLRGKSILI